MEINGVLNIYKEAGFTSHDVVAKLRGMFHQKRIGHTGTLDPDAEGVLPVCLGKGTRLCDMLTDHDKVYEAVLRLGMVTDTQDISGTIIKETPVLVSEEEVNRCIMSFVGEQMQIPPMYSAIKVNGKKLYELAREGIEIERKARKVHFFSIDILEISLPVIRIRVHCSKGTYIRTLCHDIGEKLGCGGCMETLLRTKVERFTLHSAKTLAEIQELIDQGTIESYIIPVDAMFDQLPKVMTDTYGDKLVHNGNPVPWGMIQKIEMEIAEGTQIRVYDSTNRFIGIFKKKQEKITPVKMFNTH